MGVDEIVELACGVARDFEGLELDDYRCPANHWTIGYGRLTVYDKKGVKPSPCVGPITEEQADEWLEEDMLRHLLPVIEMTPCDLSPGQWAALGDFAFNCGVAAYRGSSMRSVLLAGHPEEVPLWLRKWVRGGGRVLRGLVLRREAEIALWND